MIHLQCRPPRLRGYQLLCPCAQCATDHSEAVCQVHDSSLIDPCCEQNLLAAEEMVEELRPFLWQRGRIRHQQPLRAPGRSLAFLSVPIDAPAVDLERA